MDTLSIPANYCSIEHHPLEMMDDDREKEATESGSDCDDDEFAEKQQRHREAAAPPLPNGATAASQQQQQHSLLASARWLLCGSQFCYYASELAWTFGASIWLARLGGDNSSLFWISAYQATAKILVLVLVPKLSSEIDDHHNNNSNNRQPQQQQRNARRGNNNRSGLLVKWIIGQHACVMVTILLVMGTLRLQSTAYETTTVGGTIGNSTHEQQQQQGYHNDDDENSDPTTTNDSYINESLLAGRILVCLFGGLAQVLHNVLQVAIERDWLVVLAEEAQKKTAQQRQRFPLPDDDDDTTSNHHHDHATTTNDGDLVAASTTTPDHHDDQTWLKQTNVCLRLVYLLCEILGPLLTGWLLAVYHSDGAKSLWIVFACKGTSMVLVCASMQTLCKWVPALQQQEGGKRPRCPNDEKQPSSSLRDDYYSTTTRTTAAAAAVHDSVDDIDTRKNNNGNGGGGAGVARDLFRDEEPVVAEERSGGFGETAATEQQQPKFSFHNVFFCFDDLALYVTRAGLVGAGLALALLYANVLTLGDMMVAYLAEIGGGMASIGLWKALSNVTAILGTLWFSKSSLQLHTKGLASLAVMATCLTVSMVGVWMGQTSLSGSLGSILVCAGVVPSRFGLWGYDLSVTQLYQTHVEGPLRGRVGGTQAVLNNAMEFVPVVLGMTILSRVSDFWILMVIGYSCVGLALAVYVVGTHRHQRFSPPQPTKAASYGRISVQEEEEGDSNES